MAKQGRGVLRQLAHLYGVQTSYRDVSGKRRDASEDALFLVLKALGAGLERTQDAPDALRERRRDLWTRVSEPVAVLWQEKNSGITLRFPKESLSQKVSAHLELENGESRDWVFTPDRLETAAVRDFEGETRHEKLLACEGGLPSGYHRLTLETSLGAYDTKLICARLKAYSAEAEEKIWGIFIPIYALHSRKSWGAGDFSDFEALHEWFGKLGGCMVATLPFLASFLDKPFEPSPYSPASRLFWNEFYLDLGKIPELDRCQRAKDLILSIEANELGDLRASSLVDYHRQMVLKGRVLQELSKCLLSNSSERSRQFEKFVQSHPAVEDYAQFRAACWKFEGPWPQWPQPAREGKLGRGDYDESAVQYHRYVQWLAHEQIQSLAGKAREIGPGLYLDLPLGVHPHSYDVWRKRSLFPANVSGGAPPDALFTKGQNWGFPPLHPQAVREDRYQYVIDFLSHIMRHAGMLRIDHVMGLHRIYWIPGEMDAAHGVYVRYPAEELYAILSLESHRQKCRLVGENLGTVPGYVNQALSRHNVMKMYVVQYELESRHPKVLKNMAKNCAASLNTHDMPPFAGFWEGIDIEDRKGIGLLDQKAKKRELRNREKTRGRLLKFLREKGWLKTEKPAETDVVASCLDFLCAGPARMVLANLEDLWSEKNAQNLPGTSGERPNWRKKARYSFEEFKDMPRLVKVLESMNRIRNRRNQESRGSSR